MIATPVTFFFLIMFLLCLLLLQHVPKINGELPSADETTSDHERLLNRSCSVSFLCYLSLAVWVTWWLRNTFKNVKVRSFQSVFILVL